MRSTRPVPSPWDVSSDALRNYGFARRSHTSPFRRRRFSAGELSAIGASVVASYGQTRRRECRLMKEDLMTRDKHGTGLVPLAVFHTSWKPEVQHTFAYLETVEHLRAIGALDETSARHPQVRIANYVIGPANCGAHSSTMTLCCPNECEPLMREIEDEVRAPTAAADRLIGFVGNMSSASVDAPRSLPS